VRPVSAAFLRTVTGSHTMTARATVLSSFQTGVTPTGTEIDIVDGSVTADATADIRGSLDLTTDGEGMWPELASDLLAPYGNELFVERGVVYGNGVTEWCSLGYYRLETPGQGEAPDGPIRIEAKDRMAGIIDARLTAPRQFRSSDTLGAVVQRLVTEVYPLATIEWDDATDSDTLGRPLIVEEKRFEFLDDLVQSRAKIWYWDHRGILVIRDVPDPDTPVVDVAAGEGGVLVSASRKLTRTGVYNAIVASGEATDTDSPVRGVAVDNNATSPTYYLGRFGPVPRFYTSPFLRTNGQCAAAAASMLRRELGLAYNVDFSAVPNPALEPYDPVRIRFPAKTGSEVHILDSVTVPLTETGALTASTREQTVVLIGES
jgi:Domain of unknown function (DUF5047)